MIEKTIIVKVVVSLAFWFASFLLWIAFDAKEKGVEPMSETHAKRMGFLFGIIVGACWAFVMNML